MLFRSSWSNSSSFGIFTQPACFLLAFGWSISSRLDIFTQSTCFLTAYTWSISSVLVFFTQSTCFLLPSGWGISSGLVFFTQLACLILASGWGISSDLGIFTQLAFSKVKDTKNVFHIFDRLSCKMRYVCNLELLSVLSTQKQCLNRTFKQAATEPWKANWLRLRIVKRYKSRTLSNSWLQYIASA